MKTHEGFRCISCRFFLPRSYEGETKDGRCYLCEPLSEEERQIMERAFKDNPLARQRTLI